MGAQDLNEPGPIGATVLGYPRIGPRRELKWAVEAYWRGDSDAEALAETTRRLRADTWRRLRDAGLDTLPGNTHSLYDHVLDTTVMLGAVPPRVRDLGLSDLDTYFAMARGHGDAAPLELTKWFDTNYHYLVPEIGPETPLSLAGDKPVVEYREARDLGIETRPVLLGPVTYLLLAAGSPDAPAAFEPLDRLEELVAAYRELLGRLHAEGADWVQVDEPAFAGDRSATDLDALARTYRSLGEVVRRPALLVAGYYGDLGAALEILADAPVEAVGVDLVTGSSPLADVDLSGLRDKTVVGGVVDGRNVWRTDAGGALSRLHALDGVAGEVAVGTSCPLLHVPYDAHREEELAPQLRSVLAFADQKAQEVVELARAHRADEAPPAGGGPQAARSPAEAEPDEEVRRRVAELTPEDLARGEYRERAALQRESLRLPALATTTIGSFPQTREIRQARAAFRAGRIDQATYEGAMRSEIERAVALQEEVGLDVLVHGEPERNDMVQYFAEQLEGYTSTVHGWVQSFGTRCVRPPILHGDVARPEPMTVGWARFAQSLTDRPMKGMLTGPVTMLAWSFVRDDQPLADTARQVALAIRDETVDLEAAGISVIQVDEPALRELLPLRADDRPAYLEWAVEAFRLATAGVSDRVQVHTHMCYGEFGDVLEGIDAMDADVTSVEAVRSRMSVLDELDRVPFARGVGPGVYDIHSPRIPSRAEIDDLLRAALARVPAERLWVNPDCGLKTRTYAEVEPALRNMVESAQQLRVATPH